MRYWCLPFGKIAVTADDPSACLTSHIGIILNLYPSYETLIDVLIVSPRACVVHKTFPQIAQLSILLIYKSLSIA